MRESYTWRHFTLPVARFGLAVALGVVAIVSAGHAQSSGQAPNTTAVLQACQQHDWSACVSAAKEIMKSYPAPGQGALLNEMGDRMDQITNEPLDATPPTPPDGDDAAADQGNNSDQTDSSGNN